MADLNRLNFRKDPVYLLTTYLSNPELYKNNPNSFTRTFLHNAILSGKLKLKHDACNNDRDLITNYKVLSQTEKNSVSNSVIAFGDLVYETYEMSQFLNLLKK